ncbi:MAG: DUF971 domain-containing protein [Methylococcales bacterium]|nr:DUF971 domain-containing protein [Methylococcales bacterium]
MRLTVAPISFTPTDIKLHQRSRILEVCFDNGESFNLPCEYLRVYSPSAEALGHAPGQEILQTGKESVNISTIKAIGNYGIEPTFTDGHNSGIYSWGLLYKLGSEYSSLWANYLEKLDQAGHSRVQPPQT